MSRSIGILSCLWIGPEDAHVAGSVKMNQRAVVCRMSDAPHRHAGRMTEVMVRWLVYLVLGAAGLAACQWTGAPRPAAPTPTATTSSPSRAYAEAQLLPWSWDDRSPFRTGLRDSEAGVLRQLPGASVYHLDLEIAEDALHVRGREEVRFTNQEAGVLPDVVVRLFPNLWGASLTVDDVQVNRQPAESRLENADSVLRVPLSEPLLPGQSAVLSLTYELAVPAGSSGNYGLLGLDDGVLALPHAYPLIPAYDDHGWYTDLAPEYGDVLYADTSFYLMRVRAPDDWTLVASGIALDRTTQDGWQTVTFAAGPMRDVYLTASQEYEVASRDVGDIRINSYATPDGEDARDRIMDVSASSLEYFEELLGPFPYTEFDLVETHTWALGIEYPGIVALASKLYVEGSAGLPREILQSVVVHEVAHQWMYGLVGNDQVREPWLDESLAQYLTMRYYGAHYGASGASGFRRALEERWHGAQDESMPVGLPVEDYSPNAYSAIVYGKGALFFETMEQRMGLEEMDAFLRDYVTTYRFDIADGAGLRALAESHCGCSLADLFEEWIGAQK
jgi:aminopeptidase N